MPEQATQISITLDLESARLLVQAVAAAEVPPQIMWLGAEPSAVEQMRKQAEDLKERHFIEVLRVLKQYPWWESVKSFVTRHGW